MDVSFTNVLEGARQYFQGLPDRPSTAGATASTDNLTTSTSSSYSHDDSTSVSTVSTIPTATPQEAAQYSDTRPEENGPGSNSYWNPPGPNELRPVEPYPPQPTRVEVPDTRPAENNCSPLESSAILTPAGNLTEMQPPSQRVYKQPATSTPEQSSSSLQLHQLQPPKSHSPPPVYQQLNNVSRTPYSTAEMLTSQTGYPSPAERAPPTPAMVAPRTQYYPRYHHPDITKSTPVPLTQSATYQSANVVPTSTAVQQSATRPSPAEQGGTSLIPPQSRSQQEQHVPSAYAPPRQNHNSTYNPPQNHNSMYSSSVPNTSQHPQSHSVTTTSQHNASSGLQASNAPSPHVSSANPSPHHGSSTHIPSPHNLPPHIPSPHVPTSPHAPAAQNPSRINPSPHMLNPAQYPRVPPHVSSSHSSLAGSHMPPPPSSYHTPSPHESSSHHTPSPHNVSPHMPSMHNSHPSPHHTPSPHNNFQPHSPTYPPPPRSTPHSYLPPTSQHHQSLSYPNTYPQQPYHSFQKNPVQGSYYPQPSRSQSYAQPMPAPQAPTSANGSSYVTQPKPTYNGVDSRRGSGEAVTSYAPYQPSVPMQRNSNTHNLPPIAALSSYHSNRSSREALTKVQPIPRHRALSMSAKSSMAPSSLVSPRVMEYPTASSMNHVIPVNGRTTTVANSTYSRLSGQQNYPQYATTIAPSHHSSNSSSTTVTSIGATRPMIPAAAPSLHSYPSSNFINRSLNSYPASHAGENYPYKEYPAGTSYPNSTANLPAPIASAGSTPQTNGIPAVKKRESPLDLSVKTIKTPADSTAQDDLDPGSTDKHVSSSNSSSGSGSRSMLPPVHMPPSAYPTFDGRSSTSNARSPASSVRLSTPQTVCAPKVDFLPNFNSTPLHHPNQPAHENLQLRMSNNQQQRYAPPPHVNAAPPLHVSGYKKSSLPTSSYDKNPGYHSGNAPRSSRYPVGDPNRTALPLQEYPSDPTKYYMDRSKLSQPRDRPSPPKRPCVDPVYTVPSKQPRLDTWRLTIDQQIEQRLSTAKALHEQQQRQEMNLPAPIANGALGVTTTYDQRPDNMYPAESQRYQPYCDKRNYSDPKSVRSPSLYNHALPKPSSHVHGQPSSSQTPYPDHRQSHRMPHGMGGQSLEQPSNTGADKRVLSLLRNSLENKQQREEQLNSQQPILVNHNQQTNQNKVVAPVEPKTNIGRHNLSPFTAASLLERNSNTPPHYKFHMPRAVDSIIQETPRSLLYGSRVNSSAMLPGKEALLGPRGAENQIHRDKDDGLAAILAARIRTKAELKQVVAGQFNAKSALVPSQDVSGPQRDAESAASTSTPQSGSSGGSPPKLTREQAACLPPRRRLFSRTEEDLPVAATIPAPTPTKASIVPPRVSEFRSSSETSVFDFRESDSEGEMPVLERQTLEEMRRDRKQLSKVQPPVPLNDAMYIGMASSSDLVKIELKENDKISEPDPFWAATCDKFMEQLRNGDTIKKRGRRKKTEAVNASLKLEANGESNKDAEPAPQLEIKPEDIKQEVQEREAVSVKEEPLESTREEEEESSNRMEIKTELQESEIKKERLEQNSDEDSDEVPLIRRAAKKKSKKADSDCEEEIICGKKRTRKGSRIKLESTSGSDSSSEESDASTEFGNASSVADRLRARKRSSITIETEGMKLRSRDNTPHKAKTEKDSKSPPFKSIATQKPKPKPLFGDGSDFRPGWEEEVYVYKKSLRMPPRLITVSKPSRFHRLSTSLPDLDAGSPALSISMDSSDVCLSRKRMLDSDLDSVCSFSIAGLESKIDDEEATSSTTISCPPKTTTRQTRSETNSIIDLLAQKVGTGRKDLKKRIQLDKGPKILPKGSNEPELLPTPSLAPLLSAEISQKNRGKSLIKNNRSSLKPIKVTDSFLLGYFRKETVNNFRDTFKNNHALPNEFSTFVLKSRTRTETRVLKKQATIREVFGEDRPASAPPMQTHGDTSQDDDSQNETQETSLGKPRTLKQKVVSRLRTAGILRSKKAIINSKRHLLKSKRHKNLLKSLAEKNLEHIKKVEEEEEEGEEAQQDANESQGTLIIEPGIDNTDEAEVPSKKKLKLRTGRRKFRSGFDYIRKKKKPLKKDESLPKERKRQMLPRPSPESVADIQTEIRTWVIKKGVGETILHRAARLGYTDVAAYCLEKLDSAPNPKDNAGYTPLHEACSRGHLELAKLLLAYGANASESANGGIRPLHEAAENGATELVRLLLSYGADPLLATYSGQTPLMLALDTEAYSILELHLDDVQGRCSMPWSFEGPASTFDPEDSGYNPLDDPPMEITVTDSEEIEMEVSDVNLPVLYSMANDPDKWVLLQDLMTALRVKSRDALLRQVNPKAPSGPPAVAHREVMRELKLPDFLEQSRCCHLLSGGERINMRGSKVTLIKYNDKVKSLLNVERVVINSR